MEVFNLTNICMGRKRKANGHHDVSCAHKFTTGKKNVLFTVGGPDIT
jgi:hypothetical protein